MYSTIQGSLTGVVTIPECYRTVMHLSIWGAQVKMFSE